jgi:hypothetical protein
MSIRKGLESGGIEILTECDHRVRMKLFPDLKMTGVFECGVFSVVYRLLAASSVQNCPFQIRAWIVNESVT